MNGTLDELIQTETSFVTDIERIVDILYDMDQVFLYDTSAVFLHEFLYHYHNDLTFQKYIQGYPILLTDTIAKEMRLVEDQELRYLSYLSNFNKVLYVKEENLLDLLKVDYEVKAARTKLLIASDRAFTSIQWLKEKVKEAQQQFSKAEQLIYSAYHSFFSENNNENKGELSLLWVSTIIEQLPRKTNITFVGMDHDLYDFVERSYFSTIKTSPFSNHITFMSNDTFLQGLYRKNCNQDVLEKLISIYRKSDRKTRYFRKLNDVLNITQQKEKISNKKFWHLVTDQEIEIIY